MYGVIYIKMCPPKGSRLEWIKYAKILSLMPISIQNNIKAISKNINDKYESDLIIKMDKSPNPGCITKPESVDEIANEMFDEFNLMMKRNDIEEDSIRCVYSIGELSNIDVESIHYLRPDDIMVKVGRYLDSSNDPGIYNI